MITRCTICGKLYDEYDEVAVTMYQTFHENCSEIVRDNGKVYGYIKDEFLGKVEYITYAEDLFDDEYWEREENGSN